MTNTPDKKLPLTACRTWLPEFGTDHECCDGYIMDVDTYTEGYDRDDDCPPCFICNKQEFINWATEHFPTEQVFDGSSEFWAVLAAWRATERLLKEEKENHEPELECGVGPQVISQDVIDLCNGTTPNNAELVREIEKWILENTNLAETYFPQQKIRAVDAEKLKKFIKSLQTRNQYMKLTTTKEEMDKLYNKGFAMSSEFRGGYLAALDDMCKIMTAHIQAEGIITEQDKDGMMRIVSTPNIDSLVPDSPVQVVCKINMNNDKGNKTGGE